jgi:hypothetical protein
VSIVDSKAIATPFTYSKIFLAVRQLEQFRGFLVG